MNELGREKLLKRMKAWKSKAQQRIQFIWYDDDEQAYQQIKALIQKPGVTEEWIWKAIEYIKEYPTYHRLEEKLREAGLEIVKK